MTAVSAALFLSPSPFPPKPPSIALQTSPTQFHSLKLKPIFTPLTLTPKPSFVVRADDDDVDVAGPDDYEMYDEELEELDNRTDFDIEYENFAAAGAVAGGDEGTDVAQSKGVVSIGGWESETMLDYRIDEEEFHKISLMDCDFFIRKAPDPDNDVYDFREMYVAPPDTDVYAIPKVLAPMPEKSIRCTWSDYGWYNAIELPVGQLRDPFYKTEKMITKVFLTKHYKNRRRGDPEFGLDFEEIYVIESKTRSITRAKVVVTSPGGRNRDRKDDILIIRDNGNSFKVIHSSEREDPSTVVDKQEWDQTREDMEKHLRKLRDFSISNWI